MSDDIKKYLKLLESSVLNEKLLEIDDDVDRIYRRYFKPLLDELKDKNFLDSNDLYRRLDRVYHRTVSLAELVDQDVLQTPEMLELAKINPYFTIEFNNPNKSGGVYYPTKNAMSLSINIAAVELLIQYKYDMEYLSQVIPNFKAFKSEFTPEKNKGTIHHELAHFYDDTMNNKHIKKYIDNKNDTRRKQPVAVSNFEIEGTIHSIKQYMKNNDDWDTMNFNDLIANIPSMDAIKDELKDNKPFMWELWKRKIKARMAREEILGKNMR